ncbi:dTDP-4-dehydrorhamnose reductase [Myroides odoratus]|uniref:dTDP-4-dehydrorhamnose reductase n=1 Tax=Myroides odoratus TaxID=256 RepID=A0A9Q6ZGL1_MYROD|nr:dTDP-4-dehydrorhamnose reductase [Myroides odoratus]EHQ42506.1 dTDP-4-dehydrorhamnose reductase [Myroides odoratus DSM 2801]EKB07887.1 dTDP-4-dehydrorhamnose reductase [Myroides odoratus CIP 103059]QQT99878.1 dTDP-4-dehydrorhamnose reductase [Myroides odoratus]WQD57907.1 dTDP-4-dehydrorhamnose reductase [Myroides odoratus]STZ29768.1 dTDP-4-dehydrorhamnose reductase [Myroides odoratus]
MIQILVTGANGQMGQALQSISSQFISVNFVFLSSKVLDISKIENCNSIFDRYKPNICVNFAAYTNVEKAEDETGLAYQINAEGVKNLAEVCLKYDTTLVHISTDFVFDGHQMTPYQPTDIPNPVNVYGASKLKGEQYIQALLVKYYIIRTSWVYSEFGHNFRNTMLQLAKTKSEINVVNDQIGCPTHAVDICRFIMKLVETNEYGMYHFRGDLICSWYDLAVRIFKENKIKIKVNPINTEDYPTKAKRPKYSVLG